MTGRSPLHPQKVSRPRYIRKRAICIHKRAIYIRKRAMCIRKRDLPIHCEKSSTESTLVKSSNYPKTSHMYPQKSLVTRKVLGKTCKCEKSSTRVTPRGGFDNCECDRSLSRRPRLCYGVASSRILLKMIRLFCRI